MRQVPAARDKQASAAEAQAAQCGKLTCGSAPLPAANVISRGHAMPGMLKG